MEIAEKILWAFGSAPTHSGTGTGTGIGIGMCIGTGSGISIGTTLRRAAAKIARPHLRVRQ
jgi:hypothetical protein